MFKGVDIVVGDCIEGAIEEGYFVDVSESPLVEQNGINFGVAISHEVYSDCVLWTKEDSDRTGAFGQTTSGRLNDVLWMASVAVRHQVAMRREGTVKFQVSRISRKGEAHNGVVNLELEIAVGRSGSPFLVIQVQQ